jgi:uncharacterized protein (TIGR02271 family)
MAKQRTESWQDLEATYKQMHQRRFGELGGGWNEYQPYYRYGFDMANDRRFRGRRFAEVEPELRKDWESRHRDMPWEKGMEAIREAWEHITGAITDDERTLQLREEELRVRKQPVEAGEVSLRKDVVTEERSVDVPVSREEVFVERRPADRPSDRPIGEGETIEVPVREERVEATKEPRVYEEVGIGKRRVTETERVSDTVRREVADIDTEGDVEVRGWDEAAAGRRYAAEMRADPNFKGRRFDEAEPELRSGYKRWSTGRGLRTADNDPWEELRQDVRDAWERVKD